ncbi:MAG: hypothetical protein AMXMBFR33_66810 [Candidatus Xenobia bacterium]
MRRRPEGLSLLEVLVVGGLFLLLLALVVGVLVPTLRAWLRGDLRSQVQQNALLVVTRLREEYRASLPPTVTLPAGAITFASHQRPDGDLQYQDGDLLFQKYVVLYHDAARREVRWQNLALTPDPAPSPLAGYTPRADDRVVARNIRLLRFTPAALGRIEVRVESELGGRVSVLDTQISPLIPPPPGTSSP